MRKHIVGGILLVTVILGSLSAVAQRLRDEDLDGLPSFLACEHEVGQYQSAFRKCLKEATTLDDAKECSEVEI